ncbi:REP-associated tyrosine transposase [Solimonas terrae]|uniref:Transposase n=1 Tax=Solimonas terrae TaxID=1396819 RepID=A0A6M2BQK5_9GAMM|nr:transposase [Solimonas terrae]NGY04896.1 transposase [Solimonas terrae]
MPRYVRAFIPGGTFFFTVTLLERRRNLLTEHVDLLRRCFVDVRRAKPFEIDAIVVLPDHLHCIWTLPPGDADFSSRWRAIKASFSSRIESGEPLSARRQKKGERGIWQRRFWEHAIRDEADFDRHVDYIHFNPVKHGYVANVVDWPHSSFHRHVRRGVCSPDWGDATSIENMDLD